MNIDDTDNNCNHNHNNKENEITEPITDTAAKKRNKKRTRDQMEIDLKGATTTNKDTETTAHSTKRRKIATNKTPKKKTAKTVVIEPIAPKVILLSLNAIK